MENQFYILFLAALVPVLLKFVWFHPALFGTHWAKYTALTEQKAKNTQQIKALLMTYLFSLLICFSIPFLVIHQTHFLSVFMNDPQLEDKNSPLWKYINTFYDTYGQNFRTFKHGAFHGFFTGLTFAGSILGINSIMERKPAGFIWIQIGYWTLCGMLMGGIVCAWY